MELSAPELYYNPTSSPRTPTTSPTSIPCATLSTSLTITSPGLALQPALRIQPGFRHPMPRFSGLCYRPGRPVCQWQLMAQRLSRARPAWRYRRTHTSLSSWSDYREWRQRINLYKRKLELQNKSKEAVLNVLTSVHGMTWRQLETKVETILAKEDGGFDLILAELDATFRYNEDVETGQTPDLHSSQSSTASIHETSTSLLSITLIIQKETFDVQVGLCPSPFVQLPHDIEKYNIENLKLLPKAAPQGSSPKLLRKAVPQSVSAKRLVAPKPLCFKPAPHCGSPKLFSKAAPKSSPQKCRRKLLPKVAFYSKSPCPQSCAPKLRFLNNILIFLSNC